MLVKAPSAAVIPPQRPVMGCCVINNDRDRAPKGALLLELDVRGADPPLETVKLPETKRLRCGRAPLLRA